MKKKSISIFLLVAFIVILIAVDAVGIVYFGDLLKVLLDRGIKVETIVAVFASVFVLLIALCLVFLFVIIRQRKSVSEDSTDNVSGIGTRKQLRAHFERSLEASSNYLAFAYISFDIRRVTDKCGPEIARKLQKGVADIITDSLTPSDNVAFLEEGVFAISLNAKDGLEAQQKINDLVDRMNKYQYQILFEDVAPFHSGIYLPEKEKATFDVALSNAKLGYKYASDSNTNTFICTKELLLKEASRSRLREELSEAINKKEFEPHIQLIYDCKTGKYSGGEILSRWHSPRQGILMPAYYINNMRTTGIIEKFDMYMIDKVMDILASWKNTEFSDIMLSVNITRVTISSPTFLDKLRELVKKYDFLHDKLIIEITEDALIDNQHIAHRNIMGCKTEGFQIAIDDFGAGHSSLNDLSDYPVDHIKIDRQIIVKSSTKRGNELLHGLIHLAHHLGIKVTCEGVENEGQNSASIENEADFIQGYFYSYVLTMDEAQEEYRRSVVEGIKK